MEHLQNMRFKGAGNQASKFVWRGAIRDKTVELVRKGLFIETVGLNRFRADSIKAF